MLWLLQAPLRGELRLDKVGGHNVAILVARELGRCGQMNMYSFTGGSKNPVKPDMSNKLAMRMLGLLLGLIARRLLSDVALSSAGAWSGRLRALSVVASVRASCAPRVEVGCVPRCCCWKRTWSALEESRSLASERDRPAEPGCVSLSDTA